jgi:CTD small phosphatase-like protein 2
VWLPKSDNKKTIVFDLDETLIHCNHSNLAIKTQYTIPIIFPNGQRVDVNINFDKMLN